MGFGATCRERVARTKQLVFKVDLLPFQFRWGVLVVESEFVDGVGDGFCSHSS